jgi:threonine dehydrogenase-like Zn-dependent dehydrogenase
MRATVMYQAGDVRIEDVPDARLIEATDALVRVSHAAICGSDLWPYKSMESTKSGRRMGHEFIGVVEDVGDDVRTGQAGRARRLAVRIAFWKNASIAGGPAPVRAYIEELLPDVLEGRIEPGRVFDRAVDLDGVPDGYRAMNDRESIKVLVTP